MSFNCGYGPHIFAETHKTMHLKWVNLWYVCYTLIKWLEDNNGKNQK
jgi:hypothetical protein